MKPRLEPLRDLQPVPGAPPWTWRMTGSQPELRIEGGPVRGWAELAFTASCSPAARLAFGSIPLGWASPVPIRRRFFLKPEPGARSIRIDPLLAGTTVAVTELSMRRVTRPELLARAAAAYARRPRPYHPLSPVTFRRARGIVRRLGWSGLGEAAARLLNPLLSETLEAYPAWRSVHDPSPAELERLRDEAGRASPPPSFTILALDPGGAAAPEGLERTRESLGAQAWPHWDLRIADEGNPDALAAAAAQAAGEFLVIVRAGDRLAPEALLAFAAELALHPNADLLYADSDRIDADGRLHTPHFKPGWSPETLLSGMYLGRGAAFRMSRARESGFDAASSGHPAYELALRVAEAAAEVRHLPRMLVHESPSPDEPAGAERVVAGHLARRGAAAAVEPAPGHPRRQVVRFEPDRSQRISIVIPTRDQPALLDSCLRSVFGFSRWPDFEVVVVDNGSRLPGTLKLFEEWKRREPRRLKVIREEIPFHYPRLNHAGVRASSGSLLVFLNDDAEAAQPDWLDDLAGYAQRPGIAAAGCALLYPDGTIQHAGVVLGIGGIAGHGHRFLPGDEPGYHGRLLGPFNCAAVTAACLMVRRTVFDELGGFDDALAVAYNDVDFCLKALEKGYRNVCLPHVRLIHRESQSRGSDEASPERTARWRRESLRMRERWGPLLDRDPYYSPHLTLEREDFSLDPMRKSADIKR